MKIILVLICFALTSCIFSNKLVKKDIDAKFVYYNLDCNLLNGDELDCKIDYDLENIQNVSALDHLCLLIFPVHKI